MDTGSPSILFARNTGNRVWSCPACGWISRHKVGDRHSWRLRCQNPDCLRVFAFGIICYAIGPGSNIPPPDMIYAFEQWRYGRVNRIVCDSCAALIIDRRQYSGTPPNMIDGTLTAWRIKKLAQSDSPDPNEDRT